MTTSRQQLSGRRKLSSAPFGDNRKLHSSTFRQQSSGRRKLSSAPFGDNRKLHSSTFWQQSSGRRKLSSEPFGDNRKQHSSTFWRQSSGRLMLSSAPFGDNRKLHSSTFRRQSSLSQRQHTFNQGNNDTKAKREKAQKKQQGLAKETKDHWILICIVLRRVWQLYNLNIVHHRLSTSNLKNDHSMSMIDSPFAKGLLWHRALNRHLAISPIAAPCQTRRVPSLSVGASSTTSAPSLESPSRHFADCSTLSNPASAFVECGRLVDYFGTEPCLPCIAFVEYGA